MNIAVDERQHGRGIGRQLIEHAIGHAREQGYKTIEIGTGNSGIGQLALYQKCGFRITGVDRDFFNRNYSEAIYAKMDSVPGYDSLVTKFRLSNDHPSLTEKLY